MSQAGQAFLKCAFAPPDFNTDPGRGIPDRYNGKTLGAKHQYTGNLTLTEDTDTYFVVAPTPGVAYWSFSLKAGTSVTSNNLQLNPTVYGEFTSLFGASGTGGADRTRNVEAFRYASTAVGIYATSNLMQFAGSISVWKAPLKQSIEARQVKTAATVSTIQNTIAVNGLETLTAIGRENYTQSFIKGMYTIATCSQPEFEFIPIMEAVNTVPQAITNFDATPVSSSMFGLLNASAGAAYLGMGDMDAIIIKVTTPKGATNSLTIKTWACVEYRPNTASVLYQYAGNSPPYDPVALEAYRRIAGQLPLAVESDKNADFWNRVKSILRSVLSAVSYVPGPLGMAASGAGMLADGIDALFLS
jgi:hypothetical protein